MAPDFDRQVAPGPTGIVEQIRLGASRLGWSGFLRQGQAALKRQLDVLFVQIGG